MNLTFECPKCHRLQRANLGEGQSTFACVSCKYEFAARSHAGASPSVDECLVCGTRDLYVQKDFPHRLGISIVIVGGVVSSIAWWQFWYPTAIGVLLVTALLDLCLYYAIGNVLVCYRCLAQYRSVPTTSNHKPFDLGIGERYRQERLRLNILRATREKAATALPENQHI